MVAGRVRVSALTGEGLDQLRAMLPKLVFAGLVDATPDVPVITRRRHARALEAARGAVVAFCDALDEGIPAELASAHLRESETALEDVLGVISTDDVLDVVFRDFCIGK
jgi:tRNA modification GTPase